MSGSDNEKNEYFESALSNMKDAFAGRDGIKHLADLGYSVADIRKSLPFPFPPDKIGRVIWDHYVSKDLILLKAPGSGIGKVNSTFVRKTNAYGKQSFIKVTEETGEDLQITWVKEVLKDEHDIFNAPFAGDERKVRNFIGKYSQGGPDYVSIDFGRLKSRNSAEWLSLLSHLHGDEREYVEIMPWENNFISIYHILDERMTKIIVSLEGTGFMPGVYYFARRDI